ncbi:MAG: extracellular solute-binding protein, partial [Clostridia bacterium]|nr:extracellular solute-binding protein [Clostridia bacterium]
MKKFLSLALALMLLLSVTATAAVEMSEPGVLPFVTEPVQLTIAIQSSVHVLDYDDNYMTKMCEEDTGLDLVLNPLPATETATAVDLMLASGDKLPDVFLYPFGSRTASYAAEGYFVCLDDYYDRENHGANGLAYCFWNEATHMQESDYNEYFQIATEADGHMYAFAFY